MPRFQAFLQLGPRDDVTEYYLGEVEAENAPRAVMLAKSVFAFGQPYARTRIIVRGAIVDPQPPPRPTNGQSFAGAGLFLAIALSALIIWSQQ